MERALSGAFAGGRLCRSALAQALWGCGGAPDSYILQTTATQRGSPWASLLSENPPYPRAGSQSNLLRGFLTCWQEALVRGRVK